uniref:RTX toxin n=1 Tax=Aureimonas frigidaquae TaxID=424757 RepID=A0A0P0Z278_9HYPH|nr:RTX toxin [Aureimonas frigidaquae]
MHRIIAYRLGDRDQLHPIASQLADIKLQLEMVAEEPTERMDEDDVERRRPSACRFDQTLELGSAIAGGGDPGIDQGVDKLMPMRGAPGFALLTLIGDRDVVLCLPRRGDAQVKRNPLGRAAPYAGHGFDRSIGSMEPNISSKTSPK